MTQILRHSWQTLSVIKIRVWGMRAWFHDPFKDIVPRSKQQLDAKIASVAKPLKHDKTTSVAKLKFGDVFLVLKRYNPRSQWHKVTRALRPSRAQRCWRMSYLFADAGLNVAAPVLMLEHRFGPLQLDAYFVNEFLDGQELLSVLPSLSPAEKSLVAQQVKAAFEMMSVARLSHGDMKASNLIWSQNKLYFIDLDAAQQHRSVITWSRAHQKDRKRFLKNWACQPDLLKLFS